MTQTYQQVVCLSVSWWCCHSFDSSVDDVNVVIRLVSLEMHIVSSSWWCFHIFDSGADDVNVAIRFAGHGVHPVSISCWCFHSFDGDVDNANVVIRLVSLRVHLDVADVLSHLHAFHHPTKHRVFVVQPWLQHTQGPQIMHLLYDFYQTLYACCPAEMYTRATDHAPLLCLSPNIMHLWSRHS